MQKYKKNYEYSYALGTEPTLELLLQHPQCVTNVYIHSKQNDNKIYRRILSLCEKHRIEVIYSDKIFNILSNKENCYIIGVFNKYEQPIDPKTNHIVLVNPGNMGNLGTIIRTSIGFGIADLAIIAPGVDIFDPKTIRASMGAMFEMRFQYFDSFADYQKAVDARPVYPFMLDGAQNLDEIAIPSHYSLVFGNEATGLPAEYQHYGQSILIRIKDTVDSLNLCNAASIALYEFTKGTIR